MKLNNKYLGCFGKLSRRKTPTAIVFHHTCTKTPEKTRSALKSKGCSTHFEIDTDGTVYQYCDVMELASHCGSANIHTIGIDVTHVKDGKWTDAQYKSGAELVQYLHDAYGIKQEYHERLEGVWPHKALGNTECPQDLDIPRMLPKREEPEQSEEDFDVVKRIHDLLGMAFVDGRRDEVREMIQTSFPLLL